jgi:signal transduction histidine kinase
MGDFIEVGIMGQPRLLVVEDDVHLLSGIRDILTISNFDVVTARNGKEGLDALISMGDTPPDVIVSDIMMPYMDGFEFLAAVRNEARWITVPFIFLTAKGPGSRREGLMGGADHYLLKPFDADELITTVQSVLQLASARKEITEIRTKSLLEEQISQIMAIINHEMRTPLMLVTGYSDLLRGFDPQNPDLADLTMFLQGVHSGADRLRRLVDNFILVVELATGEAAKVVAWRKRPTTDFRWMIDDALRQIELAHDRPRNYALNVQDPLPTVAVDNQYVTIVIRELLDNAAKFSSDDSTIQIDVAHDSGYVVLSVTDQGRGIPPQELEKIWQPFYQINRSEFEDQGSGSGLAIVDGVMRIHRGSRRVESIVGRGSRFTIYFPVYNG